MGHIKNYMSKFHPIVWVLLIGTIFVRGASFMTLPFLAIYLSRGMDLHPILIGLTIGMSPFMGTIGGFIGGHLSDRFGRKPVMLMALFLLSLIFFGFSIASSPFWFILLNAINGLCNSFFEPTSQALIADLTNKENRMKAFSLRYTAINIGASVGPLVGAYLAIVSAKSTFLITGTTYLLYGIILFLLMNKLLDSTSKSNNSIVKFRDALKIIRKDHSLRYLILGGILINIGYAQIESNLPQHLNNSIENSIYIYSVLLSINAIMVVFLQIPISHVAEKFRPMQVMVIGSILLCSGLIGFSFVNGWITAILSIAVLTLGEILIFPSNSILIDQLAAENLRGTYFGASQFRKIGHFTGPMLGGFFLSQFGGQIMFLVISCIALSSIYFYTLGNRVQMRHSLQKNMI